MLVRRPRVSDGLGRRVGRDVLLSLRAPRPRDSFCTPSLLNVAGLLYGSSLFDRSLNKTRACSSGETELVVVLEANSNLGEFLDRGQLRSKSSANRSSLLTGAVSSSSCRDSGGDCVDSILYCRPSPNSMTPLRKLSSSSSICRV